MLQRAGVLGLLLFFASRVALATPSESMRRFLTLENAASPAGFGNTQVSPQYRPGPGVEFDVPYTWIPTTELGVEDSGAGSPEVRSQILRSIQGQPHFLFLMHPDSLPLYAKLLAKYPIAGFWRGIPTASTRTLYVWDPRRENTPGFFAKLTLDKKQLGLGRAVPDWEIRRSVAVTRLSRTLSPEAWERMGSVLVPDFIGAWVNPALSRAAYIDDVQHAIFRHGVIYRDASFVENPSLDLYPLFSLIGASREPGNLPPLLVRQWRQHSSSGHPESIHEYLSRWLIAPFVKKTAPLVMRQGILPDLHTQNVIAGVDRTTGQIERFYMRDAGSMKVSMRIRLARGLPIDPLLTSSTAYDFKPQWADQLLLRPYSAYFFSFVFGSAIGNAELLKAHAPEYRAPELLDYLEARLESELLREFGESRRTSESTPHFVERYLERQIPPAIQDLDFETPTVSESEAQSVRREVALGQWLQLPLSWSNHLRKKLTGVGPWHTPLGIVSDKNGLLGLLLTTRQSWGAGDRGPKHYLLTVDQNRIVMLLPRYGLTQAFDYQFNGETDTFPVYKTGSEIDPVYQMVDPDGNKRLSRLRKMGRKLIQVEVLDDLTAYPAHLQGELIRQAVDLEMTARCEMALTRGK